jgi:hypothetical protein
MPASKKAPPAAKKFPKKTPDANAGKSPSSLIDTRISELQDWRGELLAKLRAVILSADRGITEEWKWNTPVWSCFGIICTGETYKQVVKLTFPKGASLDDPARQFNSSLEGNVRRAIDFTERGAVNAPALVSLVKAAIALNKSSASSKSKGAA